MEEKIGKEAGKCEKNETWRKEEEKRLESVGMGLKTGENKNKKRLGSIQKGMKTEENKKK